MTRETINRGSTRKKGSETLTAHTVRLATYFVNYSRCKSANSYKEVTQITLVLDARFFFNNEAMNNKVNK
jgi:hypothetical protein